jgi:hypothetical protein
MLAMVALCSGDLSFILTLAASRHGCQSVIKPIRLNGCVFITLGDFLQVEK